MPARCVRRSNAMFLHPHPRAIGTVHDAVHARGARGSRGAHRRRGVTEALGARRAAALLASDTRAIAACSAASASVATLALRVLFQMPQTRVATSRATTTLLLESRHFIRWANAAAPARQTHDAASAEASRGPQDAKLAGLLIVVEAARAAEKFCLRASHRPLAQEHCTAKLERFLPGSCTGGRRLRRCSKWTAAPQRAV